MGRGVRGNCQFWPRQWVLAPFTKIGSLDRPSSSLRRSWWGREKRLGSRSQPYPPRRPTAIHMEGGALSPECRLKHWLINPARHSPEMVIWGPKWEQDCLLLQSPQERHHNFQNLSPGTEEVYSHWKIFKLYFCGRPRIVDSTCWLQLHESVLPNSKIHVLFKHPHNTYPNRSHTSHKDSMKFFKNLMS